MPEERKLVTMLFADVSGSTRLADTMDAEDVRALMNRYYNHARTILSTYGGTIEKFIGDAVMAIFGLSQVHGDDAERALAAALALQKAIADDQVLNPIFQLRIGVNTGEVVAANDRERQDFLVTGDPVNVSARLQQGAQPGEILVSERTVFATRHAFSFQDERLLQAKGKSLPLRVFPLLGPRLALQSEHPLFVGRHLELLRLEVLKQRLAKQRAAHRVTIIAPAGLGKSRLLEEFLFHLDPADGFRVASTRCLPYGESLRDNPLRRLLTDIIGREPERAFLQDLFIEEGGFQVKEAEQLTNRIFLSFGVAEKDVPAHNATKQKASKKGKQERNLDAIDQLAISFLEPLLHSQIPDQWLNHPNLQRLADLGIPVPPAPPGPDFSPLPGMNVKFDTRAFSKALRESIREELDQSLTGSGLRSERRHTLSAWKHLLAIVTKQAPRILIFEDLHWASAPFLDLVEEIFFSVQDMPLLCLLTGRPELLDQRAAWGGKDQSKTILIMQPLKETEIEALLQHVQIEMPETLRQQIVERSCGNPYFAMELVRGYAERFQRGEKVSQDMLPDTVHAAILARLDLLTHQECLVLEVASVATRTLSRSLLRVLLEELSEAEIDEALYGLRKRDLLVAIDAEEQYTFRHLLVRDVVYGRFARVDRIRLHSKIASWLETSASPLSDDILLIVASHYQEAISLSSQSAVTLDLPFKRENIVPLFERAGLIESRLGSYAEAKRSLQSAIDCAPEANWLRLYEEMGDLVFDGETPFEAYQQALRIWKQYEQGDKEIGARVIRKLLMAALRAPSGPRFRWDEVYSLQQEALGYSTDEDERWRLRLVECFDPRFSDQACYPDIWQSIPQKRVLAEEAMTYFKERKLWEDLQTALDGYDFLEKSLAGKE